jgi:uncharacterized protein YkwD
MLFRWSPVSWALRLLMASAPLLLAACVTDRDPPTSSSPTFYRSMAAAGTEVDAGMAASMISGYRRNNGLSEVTVDPELMRMAQEQARAMAARDKLDHDVGKSFSERIRTSGYSGAMAVENVGAGYHTLAQAFSGWRDSPPHRANMLNKSVSRLGIASAYAPGSRYKVFWALILAAPAERRG